MFRRCACRFLVIGMAFGLFASAPDALAADGSGTNSVLPTSVTASSTGNTLNFTYTASEAMNSGGMSITVPDGWSTPNTTNGTAGYTTANSATGIIGNVLDNADSSSGWSAGTACANGLSTTTTRQEGTASIACSNGDQSTGNVWYKNITAENWSGYTTVGFWIRTSIDVAGNRLQFAYDNNANLASPISTISVSGATIAANTWTYVTLTLTGTRTSVASYGFRINHNGGLDNVNVYIDDLLIGPGVPSVVGNTIGLRFVSLASGQTVTVAYGSGGGSSGATAPPTGRISTFTTQSRPNDAGTLTNIASSPTVTVNNPSPTLGSISPNSKMVGDSTFTMTLTGTGYNASSTVYLGATSLSTTYVSSTQLTASVSSSFLASAGTSTVTVVNPTPGGGTSGGQTFTVNNPVPTLSLISPDHATVGDDDTIVTFTGTNFVSTSKARLNGTELTTIFDSSTQIRGTVASTSLLAAQYHTLAVYNPTPGGGLSNTQTFTVNNAVPTISSISPDTVEAGHADFSLTVNGTGYATSSVVRIDGNALTTTYVNDRHLTATVLATYVAATGTRAITVYTPAPGGGTSTAKTLTVSDTTPPLITINAPTKIKNAAITDTTIRVTNTSILASKVIVDPTTTAGTSSFNCTQTSATQVDCTITITSSGALVIKATDEEGLVNTMTESGYRVDTTPPVITITAPTTASSTTITNTTIHVTDFAVLYAGLSASNVIIDPSTTAGTSNYSCTQTDPTTVDCTINITSSGNLVISATDNATNVSTSTQSGYIVDATLPTIAFTAPTKIKNGPITNTTVRVTDSGGIHTSGVSLDGSTTAGVSGFSCSQTNTTTIDCTMQIDSSGNVVVDAVDLAGNSSSNSETGYVIDSIDPVVTISAPTKLSNTTISNTTVHVTDNYAILAADLHVNGLTTVGWSNFSCTQTNSTTVDCTIDITSSGNLVIHATDVAGTEVQQAENGYVIETVQPIITIDAPTMASSTSITNTTIEVTNNDSIPASSVVVATSTTAGYSGFSCVQTDSPVVNCSITITSSGDLTIVATDGAGNTATSTQAGYVIETTAPTITITAPTMTSSTSIMDTTIHVTDNNAIVASKVVVDSSTTATVHDLFCSQTNGTTVDCTIEIDSSGDLTIKATDAANNVATSTKTGYVLDATDPIIAITAPTKTSSSTIMDTTIHVTDNHAITAAKVTVNPTTTAGTASLNCSQTNSTTVDCTIQITSSGNLVMRAQDDANNVRVDYETGYVIEAVAPSITITAPTMTSSTDIMDTTVHVTDNNAIVASKVVVDSSTTAGIHNLNCSQTDSKTVDCTIEISASGDLTIKATDAAGNSATSTKAGYTITHVGPTIIITAPTKVKNATITDTTIHVTDPVGVLAANVIRATSSTAAAILNCSQTNATTVDCTSSITSSGDLIIQATNANAEVNWDDEEGYIIDTGFPTVTVTAPTLLLNRDIEDTTVHVTDADAIYASDVVVDSSSTVGVHNVLCTQTNSKTVDCTLEIDAGGNLIMKGTDRAGNVTTSTAVTYVIDVTAPTLAITSPTKLFYTTVTDTTMTITDDHAISSGKISVSTSTTAGYSGFSCSNSNSKTVDCSINITSSGSLTILALDDAGNSATDTVTGYVIESVLPTITITAPTKASSTAITNTTIHVTDNQSIVASHVVVDDTSSVTVGSYLCTQTDSKTVDCTLSISSSGSLVISATDDAQNVASSTESGYVVDSVPPTITITSPTLVSNASITNTTIDVTDNQGISSAQVGTTGSTAGLSGFSCSQVSGTSVHCTLTVTSDGDLTIHATDTASNVTTRTRTGYVIETTAPVISITAPTHTSSTAITNTTIHVTDNYGITAAQVTVDASTTAGYSNVSCTQTNSTTVDCTIHITSSGDLVIKAVDTATNSVTKTESAYVVDGTAPVITITSPTLASNASITNTTVDVTDNHAVDAAQVNAGSSTAGISGFSCSQVSGTSVHCTLTVTSSGNLVISATDQLSNSATAYRYNYLIDSAAPTVTITAPTLVSNAIITDTTIHVTDDQGITTSNVIVNPTTTAGTSSLSCTQTDSKTVDCTIHITSSGNLVMKATDGASNETAQTKSGYVVALSGPLISSVRATPSDTSAGITWTTSSLASSKVVYSPDTTYASSTALTDTSPRVTSHSVTISNLVACSVYSYRVISTDAYTNTTTSTAQTLVTSGCPAGASILSSTSQSVATTGGTTSLTYSGRTVTVSAPSGYTTTATAIQAKAMSSSAVLGTIGLPSGMTHVGNVLYDISALVDSQTPVSSFSSPLVITISYAASDVSAIDTSSLRIYHHHGGVWSLLNSCSVDTYARSVTCTTTSLSIFALFGTASSVATGGGVPAVSYAPPVAVSSGGAPAPTAPTVVAPALDFTINGGAAMTQNRVLTLSLNADPTTVRGYAVSIDPQLTDAPLENYQAQPLFTLPDVPGLYHVYLRYYSTTGQPSAILSHDITLLSATEVASGVLNPETFPLQQTDEEAAILKLVYSDAKEFGITLTADQASAIRNYIISGISTQTRALGSGERRAVMRDYMETVNRPDPVWTDVDRLANGQIPIKRNLSIEQQQVKDVLPIFRKLFGHIPNFQDPAENLAWNVLMYRIRFPRNLTKESAGAQSFIKIFGHNPVTPFAWSVVRVLGYVK